MKLFDVSLPVSEVLPTWPGDPGYSRRLSQSIARGDAANISHLDLGAHTGSHVDAPIHFIAGARGIDGIPLAALVGPCQVVEATSWESHLGPSVLPADCAFERVLFKTRNSRHWSARDGEFDQDFIALDEALAEEIVRRQIKLVGVDYLSVEPYRAPAPHPVHRTLLEAGVVIVEGLELSDVESGPYEIFCLPVKLVGSDGAPARVILRRD